MRIILTSFLFLFSVSLSAQTNTQNSLQPFEFLVGGTWVTQTTQQTFKWGINKQVIYSELFFMEGDSLIKSGEITWFWHPGEKKIKGFGHSTNMAMNFFEYSTEFESPRVMLNTFYGYGGQFDGVEQFEKLEFLGDNEYQWTYYNKVLDEYQPAFTNTFKRVTD